MEEQNSQITGSMWTVTRRPQSLEKLYGQDQVGRFIKGLKEKGKPIPNIILFQGPTGTGKTTSAKILAKMIQCANPQADGTPCGECLSCQSIQNETYGRDTLVYDGASKTTKDEIELFLNENLSTPPMKDRNKIIIIEEYQQLGAKAQEVTLKYFEKPSKGVYFFLTAMSDIKSKAILSRCQKIIFNKPNVMDLMYYMKSILEAEGLWEKVPKDFQTVGLQTIALNAGGSFREALQLLEQCVNADAYTKEDISSFIGLTDFEGLNETIAKILDGKVDDSVKESLFDNSYMRNFQDLFHAVSEIAMLRAFPNSHTNYVSPLAQQIVKHPNFKILVDGLDAIMRDGGTVTGTDVLVQRDVYVTGMCDVICKCRSPNTLLREVTVQQALTPTVQESSAAPQQQVSQSTPQPSEEQPVRRIIRQAEVSNGPLVIDVPTPNLNVGSRRIIRR